MALGRTSPGSQSSIPAEDHDLSFYEQEHFNDSNIYRRRLPASASSDASLSANLNTGAINRTSESNEANKYDFNRGYGLKERTAGSGSEVEGYMGNQGASYGSSSHPASRGSMYQEEEINEDAAVPVNRPRNTPEEKNWSKETDIDNLTGDNNRGIRGEDLGRNDDDEIRRSDR
jgi:hypothetical protein